MTEVGWGRIAPRVMQLLLLPLLRCVLLSAVGSINAFAQRTCGLGSGLEKVRRTSTPFLSRKKTVHRFAVA